MAAVCYRRDFSLYAHLHVSPCRTHIQLHGDDMSHRTMKGNVTRVINILAALYSKVCPDVQGCNYAQGPKSNNCSLV